MMDGALAEAEYKMCSLCISNCVAMLRQKLSLAKTVDHNTQLRHRLRFPPLLDSKMLNVQSGYQLCVQSGPSGHLPSAAISLAQLAE